MDDEAAREEGRGYLCESGGVAGRGDDSRLDSAANRVSGVESSGGESGKG